MICNNDNKKLQAIIGCIDVLSMFMILLYHSAYYTSYISGYTSNTITMIMGFLSMFGLTAFTYSAGFKISLNHYKDFYNKEFYKKYLIKRTFRLYKFYLLYPIGCMIFIYSLNFIFGLAKAEAIMAPYVNQIKVINISVVKKFLFLAIAPVGSQLWFVFVLMLITLITLTAMRLCGPKMAIKGLFVVLFLYFIVNYHIFIAISTPYELPYYVCLYMIIFLSGMLLGCFYIEKRVFFYNTLICLSGIFIFIMIGYFVYDRNGIVITNNYYFNLFYRNVFLKQGLTFPAFLMLILILFRNSKVIVILSNFRKYNLWIYALQYPFTIPFYTYLLSWLGFFNNRETRLLSPLIVTLFSTF